MKKIVITGMGAVTPVGIGVEEYWKNIVAGKSGIDTIKSFDPSELAVRFAGEIKSFVPTDYLPKDLVRKTDPFMQYAYIAAEEALRQSGVTIEPERTGIVMGTAMSGVATTAFTQDALSGASHKKVGPRFIPKILGNIAAANIAIDYNMQGPSFTVSTACSSGGDAIYIAATFMQAGKADVMLAVGAESVLCPLVIYSLANAKALSRRNDDPVTASRPFDVTRDGFVIGEGGGALVLETEEHALARGAHIYAEIAGCGNTCDAHHVTAPHPEGRGAKACIRQAIAEAGIRPSDIGYINAHGTATHKGDAVEAAAIKDQGRDRSHDGRGRHYRDDRLHQGDRNRHPAADHQSERGRSRMRRHRLCRQHRQAGEHPLCHVQRLWLRRTKFQYLTRKIRIIILRFLCS